MPDDERTRRRVSDDTKGRIADLASGWSADATSPPPPEPTPRTADASGGTSATASGPPELIPEPQAPAPPRRKAKTIPPPPPGSQARKALEQAVVETADTAPRTDDTLDRMLDAALTGKRPPAATPPAMPLPAPPIVAAPTKTAGVTAAALGPPPATRAKPPTAPPPARPKQTAPPPIPVARKPTEQRAETLEPAPALPPPPTPPTAAASADELARPTLQDLLTVPVGEFDHGPATIDEGALRTALAQQTIKRDAASALLGLSEPQATTKSEIPVELLLHETAEAVRDSSRDSVRGDPTNVDPPNADPLTGKFERGDPTEGDPPDATAVTGPAETRATSGTLRKAPSLRRKRGIGGDVRYVATVVFGVRRSRRELGVLELRQTSRQASRRHHLITLGRIAVTADAFHHPALGRAREQLATVEEQRAQHNGQVAAADAELERLRRSRDAKAKQLIADLAAIDAELVTLAEKQAPLDREAAGIRKRSAELRDSIARIEAKISGTEATLVSVKGPKQERAAVQADIAMLKADREAVQRDEPTIAAELDALNPRIAAIEATRGDAQRRRGELEQAERDDQRRTEELLAAVGAKRKVVERAAGDAEVTRDKILFELGEQLSVDRPPLLAPEMAPLDSIDMDLGTGDRRIMELREILSSVDRWKLARGLAVIVVVLGAIAAVLVWLLILRT